MIDDLIEIPEKGYRVHHTLGLVRDKYDLVAIDNRFDLRPQGIIYDGEKLIYYHPFFRRFFEWPNNFYEITKYICQLPGLKNISVSLTIDPFWMDSKENLLQVIEKDYWWGLKFHVDKLNDPNFQGPLVYKRVRNPSNENDMSWPIDRIEATISNQGPNEKSITLEQIDLPDSFLNEYKDDPFLTLGARALRYSNTYRLNRFAHFTWNKSQGSFSHLDIAMIAYRLEDFERRYKEKEFLGRNLIPHAKKIKLLRIDGEIPTEMVERVLGKFFIGNELIQELLDGK